MHSPTSLAFQFIDSVGSATTGGELCNMVVNHVREFGVEGVFIADVPAAGASIEPHILLGGWATDWISRYTRKNYVHVDPVARKLCAQTSPFAWSEATSKALQPEERLVMSEAAEYGLADGFTVPIYGVHGQQSCVSFASSTKMDLPKDHRAALHLIGIYAHNQSSKILPPSKRKKSGALRPREVECLRWSSAGKSSGDIAELLCISRKTVDEHVENAMRKLGAATRIQAVAEALRQGIIR